MVYQFEWKIDNKYPVAAQEAGEFINGIIEQEGEATAKRVLDLSRDDEAVLHPCFEWRDNVAAEKYRVGQARELIGDLVSVTVTSDNKPPVMTRAFVSVAPGNSKARYKPVLMALRDDKEREIVLENAKREAAVFANKYRALDEFGAVIDEIEKVVRT